MKKAQRGKRMSDNTVGIKEIAKRAGVSQSTVSLALNNKGKEIRIAPATQEKIKRIAQEMNYQLPKRSGRNKKGKHKVIGVFWPTDFDKGPLTEFVEGAMKAINDQDEPYELFISPYFPGKLEDKEYLLNEDYFVAAVLVGIEDRDVDFLKEFEGTVPVVIFNREVPGYHCVRLDDYEIGQQASKHFLERGHKNIWVISPSYSSKSLSLRITGFFDSLYAAGYIEPDCRPILYGENSMEGGYNAAAEFVKKAEGATAVFIANNVMTVGVVRGLSSFGIRIPEDLEIISFGRHSSVDYAGLSITSFLLPIKEMACDCIQILCLDMEGKLSMDISRSHNASCVYLDSCPEKGMFGQKE